MQQKAALVLLAASMAIAQAKDLKILMIGNSFSICVQRNLPQIVHAAPGHSLRLTSAYIGGCSMEAHWKHIEALEADPEAEEHKKAYLITTCVSDKPQKAVKRYYGNVNRLLSDEKWDIVTIQQASPASISPDTYQPCGDKLLAYIRQKAPEAKVILQQTWAYRADDPRICPLGPQTWQLDQNGMYERVNEAYRAFARRNGLPIIPTGYAIQLVRQNDSRKFVPTPKEELARLCWPDLPPQASDPVGKMFWKKGEDGKLVLSADHIHLNIRGEYLQACVWFQFLYGVPATDIAYEHPKISHDDCLFLRKMARQAVETYPPVEAEEQ